MIWDMSGTTYGTWWETCSSFSVTHWLRLLPDLAAADEIRGEPEVEFSGIGLVWINAPFAAVFKVFIDDGMKALDGFRNCPAVKGYNIPGVDDPADENAVVQVRFNGGNVSFICNGIHGMSSVRVNNSLMSFTAYRFSSFCGWGL